MKKRAGFLSAGFLAVFAANLCIGKYRLFSGTGTAAPLDGVPEFLILAAAVGCFVVSALVAESSR